MGISAHAASNSGTRVSIDEDLAGIGDAVDGTASIVAHDLDLYLVHAVMCPDGTRGPAGELGRCGHRPDAPSRVSVL
jgi:hypothetical protein